MKVLHILSSTGYHGAENMAAELIRQLSHLGIKNHVGVFYDGKRSNKDLLDVVNDYIEDGFVFPCRGKIDVKTLFSLHQYVKKNNINIIHSHKYKTNLYALVARIGTEARLVSTCHNWLGQSLKWRFYKTLDKNILRMFDAVIGVSDEIVRELKTSIAYNKINKIENGIDIKRFCRSDKHNAKKQLGLLNKKIIGYVGRLSQDKGITYLFQAMRNLIDQRHNLHVLIVGDGEYRRALIDYARSLHINDYVTFTGTRSDTPLIYSSLDVFVLPSLQEAFPLVILEAMACGIPVVATDVGDIPRIIEENVSGFIIKPKSAEAIRNGIGRLLLNEDTAEQIGLAACTKVRENYSSELMARRYNEIYMQVLN